MANENQQPPIPFVDPNQPGPLAGPPPVAIDPNAGPTPPPAAPAAATMAPAAAALSGMPEDENRSEGSNPGPGPAPQRPNLASRVLSVVGDVLGGSTTLKISQDPKTHEISVTTPPSTPGEKWGRVLRAALQGLSAGAAVSQGPGGIIRAAGAGVNAGLKLPQAEAKQAFDNASELNDANQKTQLHNAQMALMGQQNAVAAFALTNNKQKALEGFLEAQNNMHDLISTNPNNRLIGNVGNAHDLPTLKDTDPNIISDFYAGKVKLLAHVNEDGSYGGVDVYHVEPDWQKQLNPQPITRHQMTAGEKMGDPPRITQTTIPANSMSNGDIMKMQSADQQSIMTWQMKDHAQKIQEDNLKSEAGLRRAQASAEYARANYENAQAKATTAGPGSPVATQGMMVVEGLMDPSQISKRSKSYDLVIQNANDYSMAKYGIPFDLEQAASDYKFATNVGTQNTLKYLNSLVGQDGNSGNLGVLRAQSAAFKRTNFPPLNDVSQWAKLMTGNPQVAAYHTTITETADQIAKILQGGSGNATSDAKMKQGLEILDKGFSDAQIQAVATDLQSLLSNRKSGLIGTNRYLRKQYAPPAAPAAAAPAAAAPAAAAPSTSAFNWDAHPKAN